MFDKNGLGCHGTETARPPESGKRNNHMDKKDNEIAHIGIAAKTANAMDCGADRHKLPIRHRPVIGHMVITVGLASPPGRQMPCIRSVNSDKIGRP